MSKLSVSAWTDMNKSRCFADAAMVAPTKVKRVKRRSLLQNPLYEAIDSHSNHLGSASQLKTSAADKARSISCRIGNGSVP